MNPRLRRLNADYQRVAALFREHPRIRLLAAEGTPPEKYTFELRAKGLVKEGDGPLRVSMAHRTEVFLPIDYPRRPPFCRMTTPVFHPNIDPAKICIGDHWSAGQSLDQLLVRIAEMICYQSYNVQSPLNAEAAAWAEQNMANLPLEEFDFAGSL
ncbi:MAG: hypothetical protein JXR37_21615 [Kiritimatiellae bacterium]|nr:hypothetical protein [Kiritimatiellia bacterium]